MNIDAQMDFRGGMNGVTAPGLLAPTQFGYMLNGELEGGKPRTRRGCYPFRDFINIEVSRGAYVYVDQGSGLQRVVVAGNATDKGGAAYLHFKAYSALSPYVETLWPPEKDYGDGEVNFVQAGGWLYIFRGEASTPWRWNGKDKIEAVIDNREAVITSSEWTGSRIALETDKPVCWDIGQVAMNLVGDMPDWDDLTEAKREEYGSEAKYEAWREAREIPTWSELTLEEQQEYETAEEYDKYVERRKHATATIMERDGQQSFYLDGVEDDAKLWAEGDPVGLQAAAMDVLPDARRGEYVGNRLWVAKHDTLYASDILDPATFDYAKASFQVNAGDGGRIVRVFGYQDDAVLVLKENAVYAIGNIYAEIGQQTIRLMGTDGCVAADSVAMAGDELAYLSRRGVLGLMQTERDKAQMVTRAVSDPIKSLLDTANWGYVSGAQAVVFDNYYILALPMGAETTNRSAVVFDLLNQCWLGEWKFTFGVKKWIVDRLAGQDALFCLADDGKAYRMLADDYDDNGEPMAFEFHSRAFAPGGALSQKVARKGQVGIYVRGSERSVDLTSLNRPFETREAVAPETASYTAYLVANRAAWNPTNENGGSDIPGRANYAPVIIPSTGFFVPLSGVTLDAAQFYEDSFDVPAYGNSYQIAVKSSKGSVKIDSLAMTADNLEMGRK